MHRQPLCSAPFNSLMVETDKRVVPCCAWTGAYLGDLNRDDIAAIWEGPVLRRVRDQLLRDEWPDECLGCKRREQETGGSARLHVYRDKVLYDGSNRVTYLEYNSSNMCNLACVPCTPSWSSSWVKFREEHGWDLNTPHNDMPPWRIHPVDLDFAERFVEVMDLSQLDLIWFKGGEPFLNNENVVLLEHLERIGRLDKVLVKLTTNATVINDKLMALISKARHVEFSISIDGVGPLNQYIRYDRVNRGASHTDNMLANIRCMAELGNLRGMGTSFAVQAYNISRLEEFRIWWNDNVHALNPQRITMDQPFTHFVIEPFRTSVRVLSDTARHRLADMYRSMERSDVYGHVIEHLMLPYHGDDLHDEWVRLTEALDRTRSMPFSSLVPELAEELVQRLSPKSS